MNFITVRYLAPTNRLGARLSVNGGGKRMTAPYDFSLPRVERFRKGADAMARKLGLAGCFTEAEIKPGEFVFTHIKKWGDLTLLNAEKEGVAE